MICKNCGLYHACSQIKAARATAAKQKSIQDRAENQLRLRGRRRLQRAIIFQMHVNGESAAEISKQVGRPAGWVMIVIGEQELSIEGKMREQFDSLAIQARAEKLAKRRRGRVRA